MKKSFPLILILLLSLFSCQTEKGNQTTETKNSQEHLTSKTPYPFESAQYSPVPQGYKPVFINYVGRHGSRHLSSPKYDITLKELLDKASDSGQISEAGLELRKEIGELITIETGNYGELSELGRQELQGIGTRMYENNTTLFEEKPLIITEATYKHRAQDSRDNFLLGLTQENSTIAHRDSNFEEESDPYLRPYDIAPQFLIHEDGEGWEDLYKSYEKKEIGKEYSKAVLLNLFSEEFYNRLDQGEFELLDAKGRVKLDCPEDAASNLYNLYIISADLKAESNLDFKKYFTQDQLRWFESVLAIEDFYEKGPSLTSTDVPTNIIAPLVKDMITSINESSDEAGIFRFAHAETMIPLASFLELPGAHSSCDTPENVPEIWDITEVSPMAANLQWIVYSNGSDKLVKMLYNEEEVNFPQELKAVESSYYNWSDVRSYYTNKIEALGLDMTNTMAQDMDFVKTKL
jgi:multiple inositol-polyphosphate phosphatase / 2,3-bisphosphoglycerate 3-phosphatase